jgi:hypothetical protein
VSGRRFLTIGALASALLLPPAPWTTSSSASAPDPLGCEAGIFDPGGLLADADLTRPVDETTRRLNADVHVRAERVVDGGLDDRMDQLVRQCPGWQVAGDLAPRLLVVMFSADEREASVFYGADLGPRLEDRWEPAIDAMTPFFGDGDFPGGVRAGLRTLRTAPARTASDVGPYDVTGSDDFASPATGGGTPAPTAGIIVLLLLIAGGSLIARYVFGWEGGGSGGSAWRRSGWSSSGRRSFGSFGGGRSGGSSRSSSGGGSRRSGGGTKKW